jgi:hypothetical protein
MEKLAVGPAISVQTLVIAAKSRRLIAGFLFVHRCIQGKVKFQSSFYRSAHFSSPKFTCLNPKRRWIRAFQADNLQT